MLGTTQAEALSYSAVKLFPKYSSLCENIPERHRRTDERTTYCGITALCVASRDKNTHKNSEARVTSASKKHTGAGWIKGWSTGTAWLDRWHCLELYNIPGSSYSTLHCITYYLLCVKSGYALLRAAAAAYDDHADARYVRCSCRPNYCTQQRDHLVAS